MRGVLTALFALLLLGTTFGHAQAHVRHYRHHPVHPMVMALGYGFAHMMASADRNQHRVTHRVYRRRHVRLREFAQPHMAAAFTPFEPDAPFSLAFGAAQGAIDTGAAIVGFSTSVASNVAVGVASHIVEGVSRVIGYRPRDCAGIPWCGCYMRHLMGVSDKSYNLARKWASYGRPTAPHVGAIVVWPHHVGKIVGRRNGQWVVLSGNDGHAVRERPRSLAGAIAFRE